MERLTVSSVPEEEPRSHSAIILIMGAEGSGKSTQAERAAKTLQVPQISVGDLTRQAARDDATDIGRECAAALAEDRYIHIDALKAILSQRLQQEDTRHGFVLDGFPRTREQAESFNAILEETDRDMPVFAIFLRRPVWESAEQLQHRMQQAPRHPKETIQGELTRMGHFYKDLAARSSYIKNESGWKFIQVSAHNKSIEDVTAEIHEAMTPTVV